YAIMSKINRSFRSKAIGCLFPYFTIHMRQLGLSVEETAIIISTLPIASVLGPPVICFVADKFGKYKLALLFSLMMTIITAIGIQMLPQSRPLYGDFNKIKFRCNTNDANLKVPKKCLDLCRQDPIKVNIRSCKCEQNSFCLVGELENFTTCYASNTNHYAELFFGPTCEVFALKLSDPNIPALHQVQCKHTCVCEINLLDSKLCDLSVKIGREANHQTTLWLYLLLRLIFTLFQSTCFNLLDASALVLTESETSKSYYGRQRFWAILASGTFSPLCGYFIDQMSEDPEYQETTNYAPAFYAFYILVAVTMFFSLFLNIETIPFGRNIFSELRLVLKTYENWLFLIALLVLGTYSGFIENFLFLFLDDLKAPKYLLGLTLTVGALTGLPFLYASKWFVENLGRINILILSFFFYFVRLYGYAIIENPWLCMPFEAMEAVTYHLMWVAASTQAAKLVPGLTATMLTITAIIHYDCGMGLGSLIGGSIMSKYGARSAFKLMGYSAIAFGVSYILFYYGARLNKSKAKEVRNQFLTSFKKVEQNGANEKRTTSEIEEKL
ncbi:Major facilitator superfamily domain-containing protein 6-like protein, partial [Dinothrombium tinctorium]